jgi:hypothetical protein
MNQDHVATYIVDVQKAQQEALVLPASAPQENTTSTSTTVL